MLSSDQVKRLLVHRLRVDRDAADAMISAVPAAFLAVMLSGRPASTVNSLQPDCSQNVLLQLCQKAIQLLPAPASSECLRRCRLYSAPLSANASDVIVDLLAERIQISVYPDLSRLPIGLELNEQYRQMLGQNGMPTYKLYPFS